MERSASYPDICNRLLDAMSKEGAGSSYVLISPPGHGKREIISYIGERLESDGVRFFSSSNHLKAELSRYHSFNEVLNDALNENEGRDVNTLTEGFEGLFSKYKDERVAIAIVGLESVSDESRDFFLYLSRLTGKYGFNLVGTFTSETDSGSSAQNKFLELLKSETMVHSLLVEKLALDDFKFLLETKGYNLPDRFVNDLYRLVNGNVDMLKYTLNYYENHRIINEQKEVDDVLYRFFPIPQALETYYGKIFSDLGENQKFIADLIALLDDAVTEVKISNLSGITEQDVKILLKDLEEAGVVSQNNRKYDISNYRLGEFIREKMPQSRKMEIFSVLSQSESFVELPLQMQMNVLMQRGELDLVENILKEQGPSIIYKFGSLKSLSNFLAEFLEKRPISVDACLTRCETLDMMGESDSAMSCYEGAISDFPDNIIPRLKLARMSSNSGKYDVALDLIETTVASGKLDGAGMGLANLEKSHALFKKRDYEEAYGLATEAMNHLKESGNAEKLGEVLNLLGNICLETFRHDEARKYYNQSLKINREHGMLLNSAKNLNNIAILESYEGHYDETVRIFKELIEESYLTGDLLTRAYSTYNIAEAYYLLGKIDDSKSYVPSAISLVKISNRNDLQYRFFRFLSILHLNELEISSSIEDSSKALDAVKTNKDDVLYKVAYAMKEFYEVLRTNRDNDALASLFMEDFPVDEEYLPIFYSMGAIYFLLKGDHDNASKAADLGMSRAEQMGETYGVLMSRLHKGLVLFCQNEGERLLNFLKSCPEPETGVGKYDYLVKALKLSGMAREMSMEEYLKRISELSEGRRKRTDLVSLFKEIIVMFTLNRTFGESIELKSIEEKVPNNFKHAFNGFVENILIT